MNGADALCDTLLAGGVDMCFANPGTSEMHFVAALDRKLRMRCVLGMFEGVVTGAADGYARMADRPAATLLHLGPGLANGLANVHNAKRALSPMINIVGDHATYHRHYDAPLTSDIESLARPMSHWVHTTQSADDVSRDAATAIVEATTAPGRIATLILPADAAWNETDALLVNVPPPAPRPSVDPARIREAARMIGTKKTTVLLLSGVALRERALAAASRIAQATGVRLLCQQSNGRIERGAGRGAIERVPYVIELAVNVLHDVEQMILIGAKAPVGFFAYPGMPSVMTPPGCNIFSLAEAGDDLVEALEWLADEVGAQKVQPKYEPFAPPALPTGALTGDAVMTAVGALLPENAILCDESISAGRQSFHLTRCAAPHDFLQLTGGAIGIGPPLATGAALACPDRRVIALQADGSAMYTIQALWTQARENLDVTTLLFSNRTYAVLHAELRAVGAGEPGRNARRMLDLDDPAVDFVKLAAGMGVEGRRVTTAEECSAALAASLSRRGPFLIEVVL
jgi:acetolactate synthase-1/2/3 large subunit